MKNIMTEKNTALNKNFNAVKLRHESVTQAADQQQSDIQPLS